jgi:hypothetical protein
VQCQISTISARQPPPEPGSRDDEDDPSPDGPEPTFGFDDRPVSHLGEAGLLNGEGIRFGTGGVALVPPDSDSLGRGDPCYLIAGVVVTVVVVTVVVVTSVDTETTVVAGSVTVSAVLTGWPFTVTVTDTGAVVVPTFPLSAPTA